MAVNTSGRRRKKRKSFADVIVIAVLLLLIILLVAGIFIYRSRESVVHARTRLEAGDAAIRAEDFLRLEGRDIAFAEDFDIASVDTHKPGDYTIRLVSGGKEYTSVLTVEDTVPPAGEADPRSIDLGGTLPPEALVKNIEDETEVTVSFVNAPNFSKNGTYEVGVRLRDLGGNETVVNSSVTVIPIRAEITKYTGDPAPAIEDFLLPGGTSEGVRAVSDLKAIDMHAPGDYTLTFTQDGKSFTAVMHLIDADPPVLAVRSRTSWVKHTLAPEDFVETCEDASEVNISYKSQPDWNNAGTQTVIIVAVDIKGNRTEKSTALTLKADNAPPTIYGVHDQVVYVDEAVSYLSGISASDDVDGDISVKVDAGSVNIHAVGKYTVTYSATDIAGNRAEAVSTITVVKRTVSEETVMSLANAVVQGIITDNMTGLEKVTAIYRWIRSNVDYVDSSEKDDWLRGAYAGLHDHRGDCYTYQMTSKALLDAAGIENKLIDTVPLRYLHCWNLVNIGDGWYHFDTTPRVGGFNGLYLDDTELMAYSKSHSNSHIYDHDKFPGVVIDRNA